MIPVTRVTIIRETGRAYDVFAIVKLMAEKAGRLTLGEIARLLKACRG